MLTCGGSRLTRGNFHVCRHSCVGYVGMLACGGSRLTWKVILDYSYTSSIEAVCLNQTWSSLIQLVSPATLLWGSHPPSHDCVANHSVTKSSFKFSYMIPRTTGVAGVGATEARILFLTSAFLSNGQLFVCLFHQVLQSLLAYQFKRAIKRLGY